MPIKIFHGTSGINTKVDSTRLPFNPKTGITSFAASRDIAIDDTGRPSRRPGCTATVRTEQWKCLFSAGSYAIGITGNALCIIEADLSYTPIRNVNASARMSYVRSSDGVQEVIYYANGHENGRIIGKVSHTWPVGEAESDSKTFSAAPIGHLLEKRNRMFIAQDNIIWYSEPNSNNLFRLGTSYFTFLSRIRMVQGVSGGMWVSDSDAIYFLSGEINPQGMEMPIQRQVADYPVKEGTASKASGSRTGEGLPEMVAVFTTDQGACVGTGDGQLINITERKIDLPSGQSGAGFYYDGKYFVTLD